MVFTFSQLADGQSIQFNPGADILNFDQSAIAAADLRIFFQGANTRITVLSGAYAGKDIVLLDVTPYQLATSNTTFANGSSLLFGNDSTSQNDNGAHTLNGTSGRDLLAGFGGNDVLNGGAGDDAFAMSSGTAASYGADSIDGGGGFDIVDFAGHARSGVVANLGAGTLTGGGASGAGSALLKGVEGYIAGSYNDRITGSSVANWLEGGAGNDTLRGGSGRDTLLGGNGNDSLSGGAGADSINGGAGNDTLVWNVADRGINGGMGNADRLNVPGSGMTLDLTAIADKLIRNVEIVNLGGTGNNTLTLAHSDVLAMSGTTGTLRIDGNGGDAVNAGAGWMHLQNVVIGAQTYAEYTQGAATLRVDTDIDRSGITVAQMSLGAFDGANGFQISGEAEFDLSGRAVSGAGDVNGDGFYDLVIGADRADPNGSASGASYVVFGKAGGLGATLDLSGLNGTNGFQISGEAGDDLSGASVCGAGDVNGDGFNDLIIGAFRADPNGSYSGASYVVFGKAGSFGATLQLSSLNGQSGFQISGEAEGDFSGVSVSGAGDVNGDGFDDFIIGVDGADANGYDSGASYVVFGKAGGFSATLELSALTGADGFQISGEAVNERCGASVSGAGDVNGDGFDDLIIGAYAADPNGYDSGASYVVFGKAGGFSATLELSGLNGMNGFQISGEAGSDSSGRSVSGAGDVNGDGFDDLIIGADRADPNGVNSGASYVVFGKAGGYSATLELSSLNGMNGFQISGETGPSGGDAAGGRSGRSVAGAGDVNGDGFDDLIIGAYGVNANGSYSGASYVVFGKSGGFSANLELSGLTGMDGFQLSGEAGFDRSGRSVSGAGDVNGDGFDDLMIGAYGADPNGLSSGASYVLFGQDFRSEVDFPGSSGNDALTGTSAAESFVAGQGDDSITGGGGADVFRGGEGDDLIRVSSVVFFDLDGGSGTDTLTILGSGRTLDLTSFSNNKITGIERINITGSGDNTLELSALDLFALSDTTNQLRVVGNAGDTVNLVGAWDDGGVNGAYHTYTQGAATIMIDTDIFIA